MKGLIMPIIQLNDIEMYYEQKGEGQDLLLIGGLTANITEWDLIVDECVKKFRVTLPENRGAGRTSAPIGKYTIKQMANDIAALMETLRIQQAIMVGSSMGAAIVQQ